MSETLTPLQLPFAIGDTLWAPRISGERTEVPCPVCKGELAVKVICGGGEEFSVPCEACGLGYRGPQGTVTEYDYTPHADEFTIAGIESMHDDHWYLRSTKGQRMQFEELCATQADALKVSVEKCAAEQERNIQSRQHKRKGVARATWTVQYHRNQIKDLERQLAWHRSRIGKTEAIK